MRETVEQSPPNDGDEAGRDHQLRKSCQRSVWDFAAGDGALEQGPHRGYPALNDFSVIEFRQRRKTGALGDDEVHDIASPRPVDFAHEQAGKALEHGSDWQLDLA